MTKKEITILEDELHLYYTEMDQAITESWAEHPEQSERYFENANKASGIERALHLLGYTIVEDNDYYYGFYIKKLEG